MSNPLTYLWRHPRRTGFIILNVIVVIALIAFGAVTREMSNDGLGAVPGLMLGYTGMGLLLVTWVVAWLAWAYLVASRQLRKRV